MRSPTTNFLSLVNGVSRVGERASSCQSFRNPEEESFCCSCVRVDDSLVVSKYICKMLGVIITKNDDKDKNDAFPLPLSHMPVRHWSRLMDGNLTDGSSCNSAAEQQGGSMLVLHDGGSPVGDSRPTSPRRGYGKLNVSCERVSDARSQVANREARVAEAKQEMLERLALQIDQQYGIEKLTRKSFYKNPFHAGSFLMGGEAERSPLYSLSEENSSDEDPSSEAVESLNDDPFGDSDENVEMKRERENWNAVEDLDSVCYSTDNIETKKSETRSVNNEHLSIQIKKSLPDGIVEQWNVEPWNVFPSHASIQEYLQRDRDSPAQIPKNFFNSSGSISTRDGRNKSSLCEVVNRNSMSETSSIERIFGSHSSGTRLSGISFLHRRQLKDASKAKRDCCCCCHQNMASFSIDKILHRTASTTVASCLRIKNLKICKKTIHLDKHSAGIQTGTKQTDLARTTGQSIRGLSISTIERPKRNEYSKLDEKRSEERVRCLVIKVVHKAQCPPSELRRCFKEATFLEHLVHPHIIRVLATFQSPTDLWILLEKAPFSDLSAHTSRKAIPEPTVKKLIKQLLLALHFLHETHNVIHCDVKPENILVFPGPGINQTDCCNPDMDSVHLKIGDFGLARTLPSGEDKVVFDGVRGSHGYFAPEMLLHRDYDHKIDVWAVGIMSFQFLVGYSPFYPGSSCIYAPVEFDPQDWCNQPSHIIDFIKLCLAPDPQLRMSSGQALQHPWLL